MIIGRTYAMKASGIFDVLPGLKAEVLRRGLKKNLYWASFGFKKKTCWQGRSTMKTTIAAMVNLLVLAVLVGYVQGAGAQGNEPYPVKLQVGEIFHVCTSGEVICPVRSPICDDLKVVDVVDTSDGLGFKGVSPGTTLCSVMSGGARRVFRIIVH
jgi:hypothetical protein